MNNSTLFAAIFEHATDGLIVIDSRGIIQLVNPALCSLFGYCSEELTGTSVNQLMGHDDARKHDHYLQDYQSTHIPVVIGKGRELTGRRKDGSIFPFWLSVSEVKDQGVIFYAGNLHDLSQQKITETTLKREQYLNQTKTRLVSMASHEFRSPLSRIQLSASLIERYYQRLDREKIMEHLQNIKMSVIDMTATLNDFLSVERIEAGNIRPEYRPFDLVTLAEELVLQMQAQAKAGQRIIYKHIGDGRMVTLDRTLLRHCLINLLSNAIKYSKEIGSIKLQTAIIAGNCTMIVSDNGIGIPKADQGHLFEAFFRASNTLDIQGTGLGLNIVKSQVELMGGAISVESQEQKGTSFTLKFKTPVVRPD